MLLQQSEAVAGKVVDLYRKPKSYLLMRLLDQKQMWTTMLDDWTTILTKQLTYMYRNNFEFIGTIIVCSIGVHNTCTVWHVSCHWVPERCYGVVAPQLTVPNLSVC